MNEPSPVIRKGLIFFYGLFVVGSAFSIAVAQLALGISLALFFLLVIVWQHQPIVPPLRAVYIFIGLYLAGMVLGGFMSNTSFKSLSMLREEWLFGALLAGVAAMQWPGVARRFITAFSIGIFAICLYSIVQHFTGWHPLKPATPVEHEIYGWRVVGNFSHPLTFANFYAMAAVFLLGFALVPGDDLSRRWRAWFVTVAFLAGVCVTFALSRGPAAALVVTLIIAAIIAGRKTQRFVIAGMLAILAVAAFTSGLVLRYSDQQTVDFGGTDEGGRIFIWTRAIGIIGDHPVFGVGQGNFFDEYALRIRPEARATRGMAHAHNDPLTVAAVSGIPTLVAFLGMWVSVLWLLWRGYRRVDIGPDDRRLFLAALLGSLVFLIGSTTEATFSDEEVRQALMFVWAVGLACWYRRAAEPSKTIGAGILTSVK